MKNIRFAMIFSTCYYAIFKTEVSLFITRTQPWVLPSTQDCDIDVTQVALAPKIEQPEPRLPKLI
jgi:hypothetical protein